jgi:hypothetical protein
LSYTPSLNTNFQLRKYFSFRFVGSACLWEKEWGG